MAYNLGIDIGIASVGFAGVDLANTDILFCGAHIFEAAENPKDGASLATPRREKRGLRRVISRRAQRKKAIRRLLAEHDLKDIQAIDDLTCSPPEKSVWDLRKEALERKLSDAEFARVLFHIAKRRGFQSNRKGAEQNDTEGKKALNGAKELQESMMMANAPTVGAYLATLPKKRNGDGSYERFVTRDLLREEIRKIFTAQKKHGSAKATDVLQKAYENIAFFQKPLQSSEGLVGWCTFEDGEKRAPKFSYTAELFVLWSKLNNTKIRDIKGNERPLSQDEKNRLVDLAHKNTGGISYKQARKELKLCDEERFNIGYRKIKDEDNSWEKIREATEKTAGNFLKLPGYHALKSALETGSNTYWQKWIGPDRDKLDEIARTLTFYEDPTEIDSKFSALKLDAAQIECLTKITNFSRTVDLSLKAIRNILPHMQNGLTYDKACKEAGYDHSGRKNKGLDEVPPFGDIRNPVVNRALAQTRKVINACIRKYGMPKTIIVELSRDAGRSFKDRKNIEREQKKNQAYREEARQHVAEILGIIPDNVSGEDILKYRLWKEQDGFCPYSGVYIAPETLRDPVATQIDHIIPYSRSWNDSYMNKVLCLTSENQDKGNDTPIEYFRRTGKKLEPLESFARQLPPKKEENLLIENFDEGKAKDWKERALNDTRYIARLLKNHLEQSLALGEGNRVQTRNGALTAHLRGAWGLSKTRENDRHHAVDAIVLACSTQGQVKQLADWNKYEARRKKPAERPIPPSPWDAFRSDVMDRVFGSKNERGIREGGIFVSRMPVRKVTGAAHQDTVYSHRKAEAVDKKGNKKPSTTAVSRKSIQSLIDPQKKGGKLYEHLYSKIEQIHHKEDRAKGIYEALKERIESYQAEDKDPKTVFDEPVYMKASQKSLVVGKAHGEEIKRIRINEGYTSGLKLYTGVIARTGEEAEKIGAIAPNTQGSMVRVDVFGKPNKKGKLEYYLVPIYIYDVPKLKKGILPNKAIVPNEPTKFVEVDDKDFLFSLYRNDLVKIKNKKEEFEGYYVGTHSRSGAINVRTHDSDPAIGKNGTKEGIGVKTLLAFHKYSVGYFGDKCRIKKEKRIGLAHRDDPEPGETEPVQGAVEAAE